MTIRFATKWLPGATERLSELRRDTLGEIRLYELRHGEAISQAEPAGRLDVIQGAISKLEHSEDLRVSTLRQTSKRSVHASNSSRCSMTRIEKSRCAWRRLRAGNSCAVTALRSRTLRRLPLARAPGEQRDCRVGRRQRGQ